MCTYLNAEPISGAARFFGEPSLLTQKLERVSPLATNEPRDTPEHAQRFDRPGGLSLSHVGRVPTELVENSAHDLLRGLVKPGLIARTHDDAVAVPEEAG